MGHGFDMLSTTELFQEAKLDDTPIIVERLVTDIDEIVHVVRFDGWQATHAGEREVKKALRSTLFRYDRSDRSRGPIRVRGSRRLQVT